MAKKLYVFLTSFLLTSSVFAQGVNVLLKSDSQREVTSKGVFKFIKTSENAEVLGVLTQIPLPDNSGVSNVTGEGVEFQPKWQKNPGRLLVFLGGMSNSLQITLKSGQQVNYQADVLLKKSVLLNTGCSPMGISVPEKKLDKKVIFVGLKCTKNKEKNLVHVSVPRELELRTSNSFELSGKGERWKIYDARQLGDQQSSLASFNYQWEDSNFSFQIRSRLSASKAPTVIVKKTESFFNGQLGLGLAQLAYTTPTQSQSAMSPLVSALLGTQAYLWNLVGRVQLDFAMPLSGQQFYSFSLGTGPEFKLGNTLLGIYAEYLALGQDETETQTSFTHSQMGVGLQVARRGEKSSYGLIAQYNGLGGTSTHIGFRLFYQYKVESGALWGGFLGMGQQTATSALTNNDSEFSQMMAALTYGF